MGEIYGRETELERVTAVSGHALVLSGEPGIGKTTLWEAGIAAARDRGVRVLVARPSGAETELSFAGLIDLCEGLEVDMLPEPQRDALEVALLRRSPVGVPPEPHAIGLGLRNALEAALLRRSRSTISSGSTARRRRRWRSRRGGSTMPASASCSRAGRARSPPSSGRWSGARWSASRSGR